MSDANIRNFAPVARIMKTALPDNAKIAKEAKECMQECVSEFISFITSEGMSMGNFWGVKSGLTLHSVRKVSTGEAQDGQWGGYSIRHDLARIRKLCRGSEDLFVQVSRSKFLTPPILLCQLDGDQQSELELIGMRPNPQGARTRTDQPAAAGMEAQSAAATRAMPPVVPQGTPGNPRMPTTY